jgi:hypothetical protein
MKRRIVLITCLYILVGYAVITFLSLFPNWIHGDANVIGSQQIIGQVYFMIIGIILVSFVIIAIINIINSVNVFIENDIYILREYTRVIKLSLIPYWVINTISFVMTEIYCAISIINVNSAFGLIIHYIILIITSCYSIFYIILLYSNNYINKKQLNIHIFLQLFILIDIIDIIFISKKYKIKAKLIDN